MLCLNLGFLPFICYADGFYPKYYTSTDKRFGEQQATLYAKIVYISLNYRITLSRCATHNTRNCKKIVNHMCYNVRQTRYNKFYITQNLAFYNISHSQSHIRGHTYQEALDKVKARPAG